MALITGGFSGMGFGGGWLLLVWLTGLRGVKLPTARGAVLLLFIPCAIAAVVGHIRNKLIEWKIVLPASIAGVAGVFVGLWIADLVKETILNFVLAGWLGWMGVCEIRKALSSLKRQKER